MSQLMLTLRQPAQIGDQPREDFVVSTLDYIPGTVVRGAFAAVWLARNGASRPGTAQREEFLRLFEGQVRFGALLPAGTEVTPLSLAGHKYEPNSDCRYIEWDRATGEQVPEHCPECGSPLKPVKPGLRAVTPGSQPGKPPVNKKRRTSVALSDGGVALNEQLFTRETLSPAQDFTGALVTADPGNLDALKALRPIRVGGRRTTHGQADPVIVEGAGPPPIQVRDDGKIIIRLRSPGIFTDRHGLPIPEPDQAELSHVLGTTAKVDYGWTRWQQAGGWHAASGLPKPSELAVAPGSTFLISTERPVAPRALEALSARGLGLRRHEGFGDLAAPPELKEGKAARQEDAARRRKLTDSVAALRGFPARYPRQWPQLREALLGHVRGSARMTEALQRVARNHPDAAIRGALTEFLQMTPRDAAFVAGELTGE